MALLKLQFKPGLNRDVTNYSGEGGWWECDKIRFRSGLPEKLGGWEKYATNPFYGVCRYLFSWVTTFSDILLAAGTNRKLYIELSGGYNDVTPLRTTFMAPATNNAISVTNTSNVVTVDLKVPHGLTTGNYVTISGVTNLALDNIGGILLTNINVNAQVTVVNTTRFTFVAATSATSTVPGVGGTAIYIATKVSPATNNSLSVTNGSKTVLVTLTAHGALTGDFVTISGVTGTIGGVPDAEINTNQQVTVVDADNFTFLVDTAATSTAALTGGTAITMDFEIHVGSATLVYGYGWGIGLWGTGRGWGSPASTPIIEPQQDWWFDSFDNDLFCNIRGGAPYVWFRGTTTDPSNALNTRAVSLQSYAAAEGFVANDVPVAVTQLMVSQQDRHLIAFGAVPFGSTSISDFDPLLIRWADQDTPADWTPTVTNSAGFIRASRGSRIVTALPTRQEILVWTDTTLYAMQFLGTTDVFSLQEYAPDISIAGPRARISASNVVYWMGRKKFYAYSGRVDTLDCTLLSHVFDNLNYEQLEQIVAGTNEQWNEIWWFYPSATSNSNDRYVIYNYTEKIWYYGTMERTAWLDSGLYPGPLASNNETPDAITETGYTYTHEVGVNDDELPMESYIQSNDFDLGDGDKFMLSRRLIPDLRFEFSTVANPSAVFTLQSRNFPGNARRADTQDARVITQTAVGEYTEQVFIRARARQMSLKVSSSDLGVHWNLGVPRLDVREDGSR